MNNQPTLTRRRLIASAIGLAGVAISAELLGDGPRTQALPEDDDAVTGVAGATADAVVAGGSVTEVATRLAYVEKLHFPVDVTGGDLVMPNGFGGSSNARGSGRHNGVDIGNGCVSGRGRALLACTDARIVDMSYLSTAGNMLILRDGVGRHFRYHHLDGYREGLAVGDRVERGELVGYMGSSGNTSWAHLHFEIWLGGLSPSRGGQAVDPEPWLPLPIDGVTERPDCQ